MLAILSAHCAHSRRQNETESSQVAQQYDEDRIIFRFPRLDDAEASNIEGMMAYRDDRRTGMDSTVT